MLHQKNSLSAAIIVLSISLFGLQACGGGNSTTKPAEQQPVDQPTGNQPIVDTSAPTIISPSLELSAVDYTKVITITFNEAITATDADIVLHQKPDLIEIPVTVQVTGAKLVIKPTSATTDYLLPATDYHLILNKTIKDIAGNSFVEQQYSFTTTAVGVSSGTATKTITFIELNDLHANLVPHSEMIRQANATKKILVAERGGLVRIAAKINEIRTKNPDSILMNIGDTYHGGAEAMFSVGNAIVKPVDALGIDIAVPGNWDFAYGPQVTNMRFGVLNDAQVLRPKHISLAANAKYKTPVFDVTQTADYLDPATNTIIKRAMFTAIDTLKNGINAGAVVGEQFLPATAIKVINGINVGFIGFTSDIVKSMHPMMALNIEFTQGKTAYLDLINKYSTQLKNDPDQPADIVVVMSELGIQKDLALADALVLDNNGRPAVDIFFSAHTHELVVSDKQIKSKSGAVVVEAGNDTYLGQMDVTFSSNKIPTTYKWTIHPIDKTIIPDTTNSYISNVQKLVDEARVPFLNATVTPISIPQVTLAGGPSTGNNFVTPQLLSQSLDVAIGKTDIPLDRKNALESNFNNAYTDMLRITQGTDIAVTPGFRFDSVVMPATANYWDVENNITLSGDITISDVYRFMPAAYFLATGSTTIENVKKVLEGGLLKTFSPNAFAQEGGWMFGYAGLKIQVDLKQAKGNRVQKITANFSNTNSNITVGDILFDATLAMNNAGVSPFPLGNQLSLSIAGCGRPFDLPNLICSMPGFTAVKPVTNPNSTGGIGPNATKYPASDFFIDNIGMLVNTAMKPSTTRKDFTDTSKTLMWPDSEFVQPLRGVPLVP